MNKNIIILSIISLVTVLVFSCTERREEYPRPEACFLIDKDTAFVREPVYLNSCCNNTKEVIWEFGDGRSSVKKHPTHIYERPGDYQIRLKAVGFDGYDMATKVITVLGLTELDLLICYKGSDDPVKDCKVYLYDNEEDWKKHSNPIGLQTTDKDGLVLFSHLDPQVYYVGAYRKIDENSYYSNDSLEHKTDILQKNKTNQYTMYVETLSESK